MTYALPKSVDEAVEILAAGNYIADRNLATTLYVSLSLKRPIFLEGEAGVGKTELAKVVAEQFGRKLLRLQCYEGLDVSSAVYEWNYARQMIEIRLSEALGDRDRDALAEDIFSERFLITRPLLSALEPTPEGAPVLLIDELDRADEPFEAFLLEVLADYQITIPEIGTVTAAEPPIVLITSNRTREIHDALKRRCLYHWIDYPDAEREQAILATRLPEADKNLSRQVVAFVQELRKTDLFKLPGVAESIDWLAALTVLGESALNEDITRRTLGVLLKYQDDIEKIEGAELSRLLEAAA
ncbi:MAG: MoxR family ATPase [Alphaproteobacteria bacterium]|nr:MoxR family ATPase [Alphaproteobacteria bacterium]MDP6589776.1 MoxR family ATPase [Alphaproteobacteria bacterium]MDP6818387.1 MoxR family ATPase [Alphaproteobacteria bacterium]